MRFRVQDLKGLESPLRTEPCGGHVVWVMG